MSDVTQVGKDYAQKLAELHGDLKVDNMAVLSLVNAILSLKTMNMAAVVMLRGSSDEKTDAWNSFDKASRTVNDSMGDFLESVVQANRLDGHD